MAVGVTAAVAVPGLGCLLRWFEDSALHLGPGRVGTDGICALGHGWCRPRLSAGLPDSAIRIAAGDLGRSIPGLSD